MKTINIVLTALVTTVFLISGCKKKDNVDPVPTPQTADYTTTATINITYPHTYSFGVTGTTHSETVGSAFTSVSNFTMGPTTIPDVVVNGTVNNGSVTFSGKQIMLVFPVPNSTDTIREEVTFSTTVANLGANPISGTGNIVLRMIEDTTTERGTVIYTLTKAK